MGVSRRMSPKREGWGVACVRACVRVCQGGVGGGGGLVGGGELVS